MKKRIQLVVTIVFAFGLTEISGVAQFDGFLKALSSVQEAVVPSSQRPSNTYEQPMQSNLPPYSGPKVTVSVGEFNDRACRRHASNVNLQLMLESALVQCGRFTVVNRTTLNSLIKEKSFGSATSGKHMNLSAMKSSVFIFEGSVTYVNPGALKQGFGLRTEKIPIGIDTRKASIALSVKVSHRDSGAIILQKDFVGQSISQGLDLGARFKKWGIDFDRQASTPIEQAARDTIIQVVDALANDGAMKTMLDLAPAGPKDIRVVKVVDSEFIALNVGAKNGVKVGDLFEVLGQVDELGLPTGDASVIEVTFVADSASRCAVIDGSVPTVDAVARNKK